MSDMAIQVENLNKTYRLYQRHSDRLKESLHPFGRQYHRLFYALKNVNLQVAKGEILGIVGRNGAGKSTLISILAGVLSPTSGTVITSGQISALLGLGAGFNPELSGLENIYFSGAIMGYSQKEMEKRVPDIVKFADIGYFIEQPLRTYSSGMNARLGFALAVNIDPDILIVDEVLAVGDELFRRKCYAKMEEFYQRGCTILFVSHHVPTVIEICTRAILMDGGEILLSGSTKLVTSFYHKLMYARKEEQKTIRAEILSLETETQNKAFVSMERKSAARQAVEGEPDSLNYNSQSSESPKAYYLTNFAPKSTILIKNKDVHIFDMHIRTSDGRSVNVLVPYEEYVFSYKVRFGCEIDKVNFITEIKTEKGTLLSWMVHPGLYQFEKGIFHFNDEYEISWQFQCFFSEGNYFVDSGMQTLKGDIPEVVFKIKDAFVFKVQKSGPQGKGGPCNVFEQSFIKKI